MKNNYARLFALRLKLNKACLLIVLGASSVASLTAANVSFQVTGLGATGLGQQQYQYNYVISDLQLQANQELDIRFDPSLYGTLSNGVAPSGFDLLLLQPNNPPGAFGDYSALALANNPPLSGTFSVKVVYLGSGLPGSQPFFINQYDAQGNFVGQVSTGSTGPSGQAAPEPAAWTLAVMGCLLGGAFRAVRRRLA
jgi:hypothetical protein